MKVLVAGATGALGKQLRAAARGERSRGGRHDTRSEAKRDAVRRSVRTPVVVDALDPDAVAAAVAEVEPDVIVHELTALSGSLDMRHFDRDLRAHQPAAHRGDRPPARRRPRGRHPQVRGPELRRLAVRPRRAAR